MLIRSCELPGVGRKVSLITAQQNMLVFIAHHTGKHELFVFQHSEDDEPVFALDLTAEEARQIGALLLGTVLEQDKMEAMKKSMVIDWIEVCPASPLVDHSIAENQIRTRTGASVIGILRGNEVIASPAANERILAGDLLLVAGKRAQVRSLEELCRGGGS